MGSIELLVKDCVKKEDGLNPLPNPLPRRGNNQDAFVWLTDMLKLLAEQAFRLTPPPEIVNFREFEQVSTIFLYTSRLSASHFDVTYPCVY